MRHVRVTLMGLLLVGQSVSFASDTNYSEAKLGDTIGDLSFKDAWYLPRRLDEFKNHQAFVLGFTSRRCPQADETYRALAACQANATDRSLLVLAVNADDEDTIPQMAEQALHAGVSFPSVKDPNAQAARRLGVKRTATAVVLDAKFRLRYRGGFDSPQFAEAVKGALAQTPIDIAVASEPPSSAGIPIVAAANMELDDSLTFAEHVAPILKRHCTECHRPGSEAPFSLIGYEEVIEQAGTVADVLHDGRMPPWYASVEHTDLANRRVMDRSERQTVLRWLAGKKNRGQTAPTVAEKLPISPSPWLIGAPDLIITATSEQRLPATGYVPYQYVVLPHVFRHDVWIQGAQILPSNPRVVHHCNLGYFNPGDALNGERFRKSIGGILGKVPGVSAMDLADGIAMKIPKGSMLALQIHYTTTGREEVNRMAVGFRFPRETVRKQGRHLMLSSETLSIPPHAPAHAIHASGVLEVDAIGIGLFSHMHLRGKDCIFKAQFPDGESQTLLVVPNYSFDWQQDYRWKFGARHFPKGTRIDYTARYDNSAFNPYNPDPDQTVTEGPQTFDEMHFGFFFYADANEDLKLSVDPKTGQALADATP